MIPQNDDDFIGLLEIGRVYEGVIHSDHHFRIDSRLASGKKGRTYLATTIETDEIVVVKAPNLLKHYPEAQTRRRMDESRKSIRDEIRVMRHQLRNVEFVAKPVDVSYHWIEELDTDVALIIQEHIDGLSLDQYLLQRHPKRVTSADGGESQFMGLTDYSEWHKLAMAIAVALKAIHRQRIVHSDIWPQNIMVQNSDEQIRIIDFGEAWDIEELANQVGGRHKTNRYMAPERRSRSQWGTEADIYSFGMVLMYLAVGDIPDALKDPIEDHDALRDAITSTIDRVNPELLKSDYGVVDIIHRCVRYSVSERAANINNVLEDLTLFAPKPEMPIPSLSADPWTGLREKISELENRSRYNPMFLDFARKSVATLNENLEDSLTRLYEISGNREAVLYPLLECMRSLQAGEQYAVVTLPALWSPAGFGRKGRLLTMNLLAAARGAWVKRVFIVTEPELAHKSVQDVLSIHKSAALTLEQMGVLTNERTLAASGCYTGYQLVSPDEKEDMIKSGDNFGIVRTGGRSTRVVVNCRIDSAEQRVTQLTNIKMWQLDDDERLSRYVAKLDRHFEASRPISELSL